MWESPIQLITDDIIKDITQKQDELLMESVRRVGLNIDKDELVKALNYDRDQYEKGYADGRRARDSEIVRCKDCKHLSEDRIAPEWHRICRKYGVEKPDDGFCDEVERKGTEDDSVTK